MLKYKNHIIVGIITLVLVVGFSFLGVKAAERYASVTISNVENLTMNVDGNVNGEGDTLGASGTRFPHGISADSTSPSAGEVRGTTLTITGAATISESYDGAVNQSDLTIATGSPAATITNSTGVDMMCQGFAMYFDSDAFSPSLTVGLNESSTGAGGNNLLASTTIATTTDQVVGSSTLEWVFEAGNSVVALLGDTNSNASSTYFSNWDVELAIPCWLMGQ